MDVQSQTQRPTWRLKAGPGGQLGGPKLAQEANLEAKIRPKGQLGRPKLTQEASLEAQAAKEANLEAPRPPRRPTWRPKGSPGGRLGRRRAPQTPTWSQNGAKRAPQGRQAGPKMSTKSEHKRNNGNAKNIEKPKENQRFLRFWEVGAPPKRPQRRSKSEAGRQEAQSRVQVGPQGRTSPKNK